MICNHCGIAFHAKEYIVGANKLSDDIEKNFEITQYDCPECKNSNLYIEYKGFSPGGAGFITLYKSLIYPPIKRGQQLPVEVPQNFRKEFSEASQVLDISPKASAALARRLLEAILVENGAPKAKPLQKQIEHAIDKGEIPSPVAKELDYIRQIGKFAAHPKSDVSSGEIIDVEPGEALATLSIIDLLCDYYYVMPAKAKRRHEQLEEKLQASKAKPAEK